MLNDVPLGASKEGRNYPSSVTVRLAEWAILCLRYSGTAERYVRFLGSKRQVQKGCYRLDSCKALGNPEQEEGKNVVLSLECLEEFALDDVSFPTRNVDALG